MAEIWNDDYDMLSLNGGRTWRGFAAHHPTGDLYILEQDNSPGYEANDVGVGGPYAPSESTRAFLAAAPLDETAIRWATEQTWSPVTL